MIPSASPYDVICAGRWHSALLTTFSLSLSFFEAVPLHALRKAGARDIGILADIVGYQSSLAEAGVSDVGRTYDVVPLKVASGCFHPKIMILDGPDGPRATVGSGNLTFGGWGHNVETMDLLVPGLAPAAFEDLADLLEWIKLSVEDGTVTSSSRPSIIDAMIHTCRKAGRVSGDRRTRLLHTFEGPIVNQLASQADALGGATEVTVVSPYFGGAEAVYALAKALGCSQVRVAVTGRAPEFFNFEAAKSLGLCVDPIRSDAISSTSLLHAKIIEIMCRNGRLLLSGSINATKPALVTSANVEASVLRIIDDRLTFGWSPTDARDPADGEGGEADPPGGPCLSARFDGGSIRGQLFGQRSPAGTWAARIAAGAFHASLPPVVVTEDGLFEMKPGSTQPFNGLVRSTQLVLSRDASEVRGWVVFDQILGAVRERGPVAEAMIRMLGGSEEPDDIAAVLSFFVANPGAFLDEDARSPASGAGAGKPGAEMTGTVDLASLRPTVAYADEIAATIPMGGATAFERLLTSLRHHVRDAPPPRRALADADDLDETAQGDPGNTGALPRWRIDQVVEVLADFIKALPQSGDDFRRHAVSFLDFVLFAAERSEAPDELKAVYVLRWIGLVRGAGAVEGDPDVLDRAFVAVLASRVMTNESEARRVHSWLQGWCRGALNPEWVKAVMPTSAGIRERRLSRDANDDAWTQAIRQTTAARTSWMDVNEIQQALAGHGRLPDLPLALADEMALLTQVVAGKASAQRVVTLSRPTDRPTCPHCFYDLPLLARARLREHHLTLMPCCSRVLLDPFAE